MPLFDTQQQRVIVRIVYDGPASAGKTANIWRIRNAFTPNRRSEIYTPVEINGQTLYFDWLQVDGGTVCGYPLRLQVVSVPGNPAYEYRRKHLLQDADSVVLVCDSSTSGIDAARPFLESLNPDFGEGSPGGPRFVLQANRQDVEGALAPDTIRAGLGLSGLVPVVGAVAPEDTGVTDTFVLAVRLATSRAKESIRGQGLESISGVEVGAVDVFGRIVALDARISDVALTSAEHVPETSSEASHAGATPAGEVLCNESPAYPPLPTSVPEPGMYFPREALPVLRTIDLPNALLRCDLVGRQGPDEGSGTSDTFIYEAAGWCLKTSSRRCYQSLDEAHGALHRLVIKKDMLGHLKPANSVFLLQPDHRGHYWLWTVTPWLTTLRSLMNRSSASGDDVLLGAALASFARVAVEALALTLSQNLVLDIHPSNFAVEDGSVVYIDDDIALGSHVPSVGYNLLQRVDEYGGHPSAVEMYLFALEDSLLQHLTSVQVRQLGLSEAVEQAIVRTSAGQHARLNLLTAMSKCRHPGLSKA